MFALVKNRRSIDRLIILPAIVFIVQALPWLFNRMRIRVLVPLMLIYVVSVLVRQKSPFTNRIEIVCSRNVLGYSTLFFCAYWATSMLYTRAFDNGWMVCFVMGLFSLFVFIQLASENRVREIKILTCCYLASLLLASFQGSSYLASEYNQNIIRAATAGNIDDKEVMAALDSGVGGFGFVYSLGLLIPGLFYSFFKIKNMMRWVLLVGALFGVLYVYRAGFAILMVVLLFGLIWHALSALCGSYQNYRIIMMAMIVFLLAVTIIPGFAAFLASPLIALADVVGNENYVFRINSMVDSISGGGDDYALNRTGLMWRSFNIFLAHPFWGASRETAPWGGHSFFFDYLAAGGLLFFIPYPLFFIAYTKYMKTIIYPLSPSAKRLIETYFYMYVTVTFLNPLNSYIVWASFFFVLPGLTLFYKDSLLNRPVYQLQGIHDHALPR